MKRKQKMKVLAFSMFAGMVAASAPCVNAVEVGKFQNTASSESQAQIVMSFDADSTEIKPGDKFTVTLSLDKLPDNNKGVGGISFRMAYDGTKVTAATKGNNIPDVKKGEVGTFLGMRNAGFGEAGDLTTIAVGMSVPSDEAFECPTGNVLSIEFTALDNITPGVIPMFLTANYVAETGFDIAGFSVSGVKVDPESGYDTPDTSLPVYVKSNLDNLNAVVEVEAESVRFSTNDPVNLNTANSSTVALGNQLEIDPAGARNNTITWESSDPNVATVDSQGTVTAVNNGTVTITATVDGKSATKTVNVKIGVESVALAKNTVSLDVVEKTTEEVGFTVNPTNAQPEEATVTSSNPSVATATVDKDTKKVTITAHQYGSATITLTVDGKTAVANVNVTVPLGAITLDKESVTVYKGESDTVKVTADPEGSSWETLSQSTKSGDGTASAEVNAQTGVVTFTGLERGNSVISIYANNDQNGALIKDVNVTVKENRITSLTITGQEEEFLRGQTQTLATELAFEEPETVHKTTDEKTITWESSNPDVATVDQNGKVTAVSSGVATITAKMPGTANNVQATYDVQVVEYHVDGLVFAEEDEEVLKKGLDVEPGDVVVIPFTVDPENTTDTDEEINELIKTYFDEDVVDVEVTYKDGKGEIKLTYKKDGLASGVVTLFDLYEDDIDYLAEEYEAYENYLATGEIPEDWLVDYNGDPLEGEDREEAIEWIKDYFDNFFEYWAEDNVYFIRAHVTTPVEENADTSDIPVAATATVMIISLGGIVITRKVLVK